MSDTSTGSGDSPEREREKRDAEHEQRDRMLDEGAPADRAGKDPADESALEGVPATEANRPTG